MRILLALLLASCSDDPLTRLTGALEVTAINAPQETATVQVEAQRVDRTMEGSAPIERPGTIITIDRMDPGSWAVRVEAQDANAIPLHAVLIEDVGIRTQQITELLVDLTKSEPGPGPGPGPSPDLIPLPELEAIPEAEPTPEPDPDPMPTSEIGCADGEREGFLSETEAPAIAGCSGGWSLPGVDVTAMCNHAAGDDSSNPDGTACSAADLCSEGWHICDGKTEVASHSSSGCAGAVPPGTPDKSLFFAVRQPSLQGSVCSDDGTGDNDVFGCGNLGNQLGADKNCAPLDRVLASTQPNRCGFNEAEPPLGPWQCLGSSDSHFHEGALVTKSACTGSGACSYDGLPVRTADKGGVLCCKD